MCPRTQQSTSNPLDWNHHVPKFPYFLYNESLYSCWPSTVKKYWKFLKWNKITLTRFLSPFKILTIGSNGGPSIRTGKFGRWLATGPHFTGSQIRQEGNLPLASIGLSSNYKIIKTKTNLVLTCLLLKIFHNAEADISINEKGTPYTFRKFNWNITNAIIW